MNDIKFRVFRIKISISFWFAALITLYAVVFENSLRVILAIVLHECAHAVFIYLFGSRISCVSLKLTDIRIEADFSAISKPKRLCVALAGPAANLLACVTSLLYEDEVFFSVNLVIALFQLLPSAASDGGEVIDLLMGQSRRKWTYIIYFVTASAVFLAGLLLLMECRYNYSLLIAGVYIIIMTCK